MELTIEWELTLNDGHLNNLARKVKMKSHTLKAFPRHQLFIILRCFKESGRG